MPKNHDTTKGLCVECEEQANALLATFTRVCHRLKDHITSKELYICNDVKITHKADKAAKAADRLLSHKWNKEK